MRRRSFSEAVTIIAHLRLFNMLHQLPLDQPSGEVDELCAEVSRLLSSLSLSGDHASSEPERGTALKLLFSNAASGIVIGRGGANR